MITANNEALVFFKKIVVRTPSASFTSGLLPEDVQKNFHEKDFLIALFAAAPAIHELATSWIEGRLTDPLKIRKLEDTLFNYYKRMYSNPTPFGYFASAGTLEWGANSSGEARIGKQERDVRLDMEVLHHLLVYINRLDTIKEKVSFSPNNTIYRNGDQLRYIEVFEQNGSLQYKISAVDDMPLLAEILELTGKGMKIYDLCQALIKSEKWDYDFNELHPFILELIDSQVLISSINLSIIGEAPLERTIRKVKELNVENQEEHTSLMNDLENISALLKQLSNQENDYYLTFKSLFDLVIKYHPKSDPKKLVQADLYTDYADGKVDDSIQQNLVKAIEIISCFNQKDFKPRLDEFKRNFLRKYEDAAVPLLEAIDTESGISFGEFKYQVDNILLGSYSIQPEQSDKHIILEQRDASRQLLCKKYHHAYVNKDYTIHFEDKDLKHLQPKIEQLAPTFQILFSVIKGDQNLISLSTAGNVSAGNLIARFGSFNKDIANLLEEISSAEEDYYSDAIPAEIAHIPEHRIGNISFRPHIRKYEIPVLTQSVLPEEFQIPLSDLYLCIRHNRIILFSKKLNKRIIPTLTNAHNYNKKTCPIYQFLSELQFQDILPSLSLEVNEFDQFSSFNPRIQYKNIILKHATWSLGKPDFEKLISTYKALNVTMLNNFRLQWGIPLYTESNIQGNSSVTDWSSIPSVQNFLGNFNKLNSIVLKEFVYDTEDSFLVDQKNQPHYNQCIAFVKNTRKKSIIAPQQFDNYHSATQRNFIPGDKWIYYKLYCGIKHGDNFLKERLYPIFKTMKAAGLVEKFFFIRFQDPDYHLRIRFLSKPDQGANVIAFLEKEFRQLAADKIFWKIQLDTYVRELERYGPEHIELAESFFEADSSYCLQLLNIPTEDISAYLPLFFIRSTDLIFDAFGLELSARYRIIGNIKNAYEYEFGVDKSKELQKVVNNKEQEYRTLLTQIMADNFNIFQESINTASLFTAMQEYKQDIIKIRENAATKLSSEDISKLLPGLIHMHAIRTFPTRPRETELFAYNLLWANYKKAIHTKKSD